MSSFGYLRFMLSDTVELLKVIGIVMVPAAILAAVGVWYVARRSNQPR